MSEEEKSKRQCEYHLTVPAILEGKRSVRCNVPADCGIMTPDEHNPNKLEIHEFCDEHFDRVAAWIKEDEEKEKESKKKKKK
jgi:hypothetical protein